MKKDNTNRLGNITEEDMLFPKHLKPCVIHGALFIHNGKDTKEKLKRSEHILNKIGTELASYSMALLCLPQIMDNMRDSQDYKEFEKKLHSQTVH